MKKKKKARRGIALTLMILLLAAGFFVYRYLTRSELTDYSVVTAQTGDITTYYSFTGTVSAVKSEVVYASSVMQVSELYVSEGQVVKKDDALCKTSAGTKIKAPNDGTVTDLNLQLNAAYEPGAKLCKVTDYTKLELNIQVDEYDLSAVKIDKSASVTINALSRTLTGKVSNVAREGVPASGVTYFNAEISLPQDQELRVGMTAQAKILNQSVKAAILLPMSAIQFDSESKPYVYVSTDGRTVQKVPVTLGINDGTNAAVTSGIADAQTVYVPIAASDGIFGGMGNSEGAKSTSAQSTQAPQTAAPSGGGGR